MRVPAAANRRQAAEFHRLSLEKEFPTAARHRPGIARTKANEAQRKQVSGAHHSAQQPYGDGA